MAVLAWRTNGVSAQNIGKQWDLENKFIENVNFTTVAVNWPTNPTQIHT